LKFVFTILEKNYKMVTQRIFDFLYADPKDLNDYDDLRTNNIIIQGEYSLTLLDVLCLNVHDSVMIQIWEMEEEDDPLDGPSFRFVIEKIEWMLESPSVDVNFQGDRGFTILHCVASQTAVERGRSSIQVLNILLSKGADPNVRFRSEKGYSSGRTILMSAVLHCEPSCGNSNIETVKILLDAGADINARNAFGYTAIMYACMYSSPNFFAMSCPEVIDLLLERGADTGSAFISEIPYCETFGRWYTAYEILQKYSPRAMRHVKNLHMIYGYPKEKEDDDE